jgi:hypothetical protein
MKRFALAMVLIALAPLCATGKVDAQAQTPGNPLKLCNRTAGSVSATYTLRDLAGSKPAELFIAPGACQSISLSGYIGKITLGGKELTGSDRSFSSVELTPSITSVVVVTFSSQCASLIVAGSGYCLYPQ